MARKDARTRWHYYQQLASLDYSEYAAE
jgi:hypothetical protein